MMLITYMIMLTMLIMDMIMLTMRMITCEGGLLWTVQSIFT